MEMEITLLRFPGDFLMRRTAGNVFELAGIAAFRASPVWVLAALSDSAGASKELIAEISDALQKDGLLPPGQSFRNVSELLDGLESTAGKLAETVNTPPTGCCGTPRGVGQTSGRSVPSATCSFAGCAWI